MKANQLTVGTKVKYFPLLSNKSIFTEHTVTHEPWVVCGEFVVKLSDKSGSVSVDHVQVVQEAA